MDYMFYTPPYTAPTLDYSVPFDQALADLEEQHFAATDRVKQIEDSIVGPINENLDAETRRELMAHLDQRLAAAKTDLGIAESALLNARDAKQDEWNAYRAEQSAEGAAT